MVVKSVTVNDFRGIPGRLEVEFTEVKTAKAASVLVHGENGSGKSSVVDALEFALRGKLSRRGLHGEKTKREVRNLASNGTPGVLVKLLDGSAVRRGGGIRESGLADLRAEIVDGFQFCPVVIRRQDVETFWAVPSLQRQEFFFDYIRDPRGGAPLAQELAERAARRESAESKVTKARDRLQQYVGDDLPIPQAHEKTRGYLHSLLRRHGVGPRKKRLLPKPMYDAFVEYQNALLKVEGLERERLRDPVATMADHQLREILEKVSGRVSEDFRSVARKPWILRVNVELGDEADLDITIRLTSGHIADPVQVLNEAALDLLALLILVEVHIECATLGQRKLLVLDDVFQSVDSVHRVRALEHVLERLAGWQLILTLHDRLWLELARTAMQRTGHGSLRVMSLRSTPHDLPPEVRDASTGPLNDLRRLILDPISPELVAAACGRALEQLCDRLSVSLQVSVTRRRGDAYTLGDLWPGVKKALLKVCDDELSDAVVTTDRFLALRNVAGAHYNAWAESLAEQEALDFAEGVIGVWEHSTCPSCGALLTIHRAAEGSNSSIDLGCRCSRL